MLIGESSASFCCGWTGRSPSGFKVLEGRPVATSLRTCKGEGAVLVALCRPTISTRVSGYTERERYCTSVCRLSGFKESESVVEFLG